MPLTRVTRTLAAPPERVWRVLADPHQQPRWFPRVRRVEAVDSSGWTQVMQTAKGRGVRADFRLLEEVRPSRLVWSQEVEGTPFGRILAEAQTTFVLSPGGDVNARSGSTELVVELRQRLKGWARFAPFLFRGAARRQLDEALDGLERAI